MKRQLNNFQPTPCRAVFCPGGTLQGVPSCCSEPGSATVGDGGQGSSQSPIRASRTGGATQPRGASCHRKPLQPQGLLLLTSWPGLPPEAWGHIGCKALNPGVINGQQRVQATVSGSSTPGPKESGCGDWHDGNVACQRCPPHLPQWSKNRRGVRVRAELYEEEMGRNKELFPELADLGCVAALQAWLQAYGFKLKRAK